jgi:hypothetical protein
VKEMENKANNTIMESDVDVDLNSSSANNFDLSGNQNNNNTIDDKNKHGQWNYIPIRRKIVNNGKGEKKRRSNSPIASTSNRFDLLAPEESSKIRKTENTGSFNKNIVNQGTYSKNEVKKFCPPIFIDNMKLKEVRNFIEQKITITDDNYKVINNNRKGKSKIFVKDHTLHGEILAFNKTNKIEGHSFTPYELKTTNLLLKNVCPIYTIDDVEIFLKNKLPQMKFRKIAKFSTINSRKNNVDLGMIIVQVEPNQDIEELLKIRHILGQGIRWERLKLSGPIQCMNCQDFGHAAANCSRGYRCVKCRLNHGPKECPYVKGKDAPSCTNCGEEHPASYRGCSYYKDILKARKKMLKTREKVQYIQYTQNDFIEPIVTYSQNRVEDVSYATITRNDPLPVDPQKNSNSTVFNEFLSIPEQLFGISLPTLLREVNSFMSSYNKIITREGKQTAYLQFITKMLSKNQNDQQP